jgi:RHS repeat-associated protein
LTSETVAGDPSAIDGAVSYIYDSVGNRQRRDGTLGPVSAQVSGFNVNDQIACEQYDLNGNVIQDCDGSTFTWDFEDHLLGRNGGQVSLLYDGDGTRVGKTAAGVSTAYLIDDVDPTGYSQVLEELAAGPAARRYGFGKAALVEIEGGAAAYLLTDGQRSVRSVSGPTASLLGVATFDAFGNPLRNIGFVAAHAYAGERRDSDVGADELRARDLVTDTGRFRSADKFEGRRGNPLTQNRYAYVVNDPVNRVDPSGFDGNLLETSTVVTVVGINVGLRLAVGAATVAAVLGGPKSWDKNEYGGSNMMRVQLQLELEETWGLPVPGPKDPGVTVAQMQGALGQLYADARLLPWFPFNRLERSLRKAIVECSERLNVYPSIGGVFIGGQFYQCTFEDHGDEYRVDLENLRGHNLRR